jgi:hypothetical protein
MKKYIIIGTIIFVACKPNPYSSIDKKTSKPPCTECPDFNKKKQGKYGGK